MHFSLASFTGCHCVSGAILALLVEYSDEKDSAPTLGPHHYAVMRSHQAEGRGWTVWEGQGGFSREDGLRWALGISQTEIAFRAFSQSRSLESGKGQRDLRNGKQPQWLELVQPQCRVCGCGEIGVGLGWETLILFPNRDIRDSLMLFVCLFEKQIPCQYQW